MPPNPPDDDSKFARAMQDAERALDKMNPSRVAARLVAALKAENADLRAQLAAVTAERDEARARIATLEREGRLHLAIFETQLREDRRGAAERIATLEAALGGTDG